MATKLIGWSVDEYRKWAKEHEEQSRTTGLRHWTPEVVRLSFDSGPPKIAGYASVFNTFYELWDGFQERVAPGAFANTIAKDDVRALLNHDPNYVLGRNTAGTLTLREDEHGLYYEIIPPDTSFAKDLQVSLKRKDITQSSFGFNIVNQNLKYDKENDLVSRTLTEVKLFDVSPVTFPASPQTEAQVRMTGNPGGSEDLIVVPEDEVVPVQLTDEELFKRFEDLKTQVR